MKANELMIDDWVNSYDAQAYKVTSIHINDKGCAVRLEFDEYIVETWADKIEPIPLTEEILKANGFEFSQKSDDLHYRSYRLRDIVVFWRTNADNVCFAIANHSVDIHYVHELQHALRLCGLNALADNFKIQ